MNPIIQHDTTCPCGTVLIVDDEQVNRLLLHDPLEAQGHQILEAENGEQALQLAVEQRPDVVLLDIMMPRMDGFEVCRRLKGDPLTAHLPVLLVTALTDRQERLLGIQAGANDFFTKPIDITEIILRVRNAIHTKRLFDQLQASLERLQELESLRAKLTRRILLELHAPLSKAVASLKTLHAPEGSETPGAGAPLTEVQSALSELLGRFNSMLELHPAPPAGQRS